MGFTMKKPLVGIGAMVVAIALIAGCTSSSDPSPEPRLEMRTSMSSDMVKASSVKTGAVQGGLFADSIRVDSVRILISRIKLKRSDEDTTNGGRDVKTGPALIVFARAGVRTAFNTPIPTGTYDKIKLEMHKFSGSEAEQYRNDPVFRDFATDRVTVIVDGTVYEGGTGTAFRLENDDTENLWMKFDPSISITASTTTSVTLDFDAVQVFRAGGSLLHPRDPRAGGLLKERLKLAFKLTKR